MSRTDSRLLETSPYPARPTRLHGHPPTLIEFMTETRRIGDAMAAELTKVIEAIDGRRSIAECDRALRAVRLSLGTLALDLADVRYRAARSQRLYEDKR